MISAIIPISNAYNGKAMPEREEALSFGIKNFYSKHDDIEIVVVAQNYIPTGELAETIRKHARIISLDYPVFNKGWCINVGARHSCGDILCIAESDMYSTEKYLNKAALSLRHWKIAWNRLIYTTKEQRNEVLFGKEIVSSEYSIPKRGSSEGGIVLFKKEFFIKIGGCNEWFEELGGPDNEIAYRAHIESMEYPTHPQTIYHLWHEKCRVKNSLSRIRNKALYQSTINHPLKFNRFLAKQNFGNVEFPLCSKKNFKTAWSEQ